jgi:hypothetical protein
VFQLGSTTSATFRGLPGASFSRTDTNGTATALDLAGNVIQFATGVPRITNQGLLVEEGRANSLLQSNTFSNAAWTTTGATVATTTDTLGPDGTLSAWKLAETATTSTHIVSQSVTYTAGGWTSSVYVKAAERGFALLSLSGITFVASINLSTGAVSAATGGPTVTSIAGPNGWWRVTCSGTVTANTSAVVIYASTDGVFANRSYAGTAGSGIYIAFAQAEAGSFPTSPIITTGAAGTRGQDNPFVGTLPRFASGLTLLAEVETLRSVAGSVNEYLTTISDNTLNNRISLFRTASAATLASRVTNGGSSTNPGDIASGVGLGIVRAGMSVQAGRAISAAGGILSSASTPAAIPTYEQVTIGTGENQVLGPFNAYIRRIRIIPRAVSDAELVSLTSP